MRKYAVLAIAVCLLVVALPAGAVTPADVFRDAQGNLYIHGAIAEQLRNRAELASVGSGAPVTRRGEVGRCGEIRIAPDASMPAIGDRWTVGTLFTVNEADLQVVSEVPHCVEEMILRLNSGDFKNESTGVVTLARSLTPNTSYAVTNGSDSQTITAGACGELVLSPLLSSGSMWTISGGDVWADIIADWSDPDFPLPSYPEPVPNCTREGTGQYRFQPSPEGHFKAPDGSVTLIGFEFGNQYQITFEDRLSGGSNSIRAARIGQCGYFRFRNLPPIPESFSIAGQSYTFSTLPQAEPPLCLRDAVTRSYFRFVPYSWSDETIPSELFKDNEGRVYLTGLTPGVFTHFSYINRPRRVDLISGDCGLVQMWSTNRFIIRDRITIYTLPNEISFNPQNVPHADFGTSACMNGVLNADLPWQAIAPGIEAVWAFRANWNRFTEQGREMIFVRGLPANLEATDHTPASRVARANPCGVVRLSNTPLWNNADLGSGFYYQVGRSPSGETYNYETLPVRSAPPMCRGGVLYRRG